MAWLGTWAKRVKITVDSGDIDADLTHFPLLVHISATCGKDSEDLTAIFDEVGAESKKIAITKSDGTTQLYVEIEGWDSSGEEAWLWVSKSDWVIANASDTEIYIYYDSTQGDNDSYVGIKKSVPAEAVWDSSFVMVQHLEETGGDATDRVDSSSNDLNMNMVDITDPTVAGKIGIADDYEKSNTDYGIELDVGGAWSQTTMTVEGWIKPESVDNTEVRMLFEKRKRGITDTHCNYQILILRTSSPETFIFQFGDGTSKITMVGTTEVAVGEWWYVAGTFNDTTKLMCIYVGRVATPTFSLENSGTKAGSTPYTADTQDIAFGYRIVSNNAYVDGIMDELRISSTDRSIDWLKATFESNRDNLVSFGIEELISVVAAGGSVVPLLKVLGVI